MWSWVSHAVGIVALHPTCALVAVFIAAIVEAVAVVGILIPGTPILMAVAGAAAMAGRSMTPFLLLSILGAVMGDFLSFWVGNRYRGQLMRVWPFSSRPELMENAGSFFARYGVLSVALCRFVPVLRSTVPLFAGMAGMRQRRFVAANVASALVWAPLHIYPAKMAGLSINQLRDGNWSCGLLWGGVLLAGCTLAWALHRAVMPHLR